VRIGFLTTSFPRREGDGAGTFVLGMARALAARGHRIEVIAPEADGPCSGPDAAGVDVHRVAYLRPSGLQRLFYGAGAPDNLARDPWAAIGAAPFLARFAAAAHARASRWDAVVSHWAVPAGLVGAIAAGGRPHLVVCHGSDVRALEKTPGGSRLAGFVADRATSLVFVAAPLRDAFLRLAPRRIAGRCHVCPMGIDLPDAAPPERGSRDPVSLLFLGRLVRSKGVDLLPAALGGLRGVRLVVAGDGPLRDTLGASLAEAGIDAELPGFVSGARKADAFAGADALVHPSRSEGSPVAVLEAMATGLPVVATDVGGVPSVVRDGVDGLIVAPGSPDALRGAVVRMRDAALRRRMGESAARRAGQFAWPVLAPRIEGLLTASA
jgi:glycosyltransferase involved in cell wall biosynthesis